MRLPVKLRRLNTTGSRRIENRRPYPREVPLFIFCLKLIVIDHECDPGSAADAAYNSLYRFVDHPTFHYRDERPHLGCQVSFVHDGAPTETHIHIAAGACRNSDSSDDNLLSGGRCNESKGSTTSPFTDMCLASDGEANHVDLEWAWRSDRQRIGCSHIECAGG